MAETMTPSAKDATEMTNGQIDKAGELFRSILKRHRAELPSEAVQQVLGNNEVWPELLAVFRKRVEAVSNTIARRVTVTRIRPPQSALDATGRRQYTNPEVVAEMPGFQESLSEEVDVYFFQLGRYVSDEELDREYELRGLKPADPYALAAVNEIDPAFADGYPNGTDWKDSRGRWCFAMFGTWRGERHVHVDRYGSVWDDGWWFAGVRK